MAPAARTLADYGTIARRSWWLIVGTVLAALAAGLGYTAGVERVYESTASVLVAPTAADTSVAGARTSGQVNLDTEAQLVKSTEVTEAAARALGLDSAADLKQRISVSVPPNTSVLEISFRADSPERAQEGTVAVSEAYLSHRREAATASIESAIAALEPSLGDGGEIAERAAADIAALQAERDAVIPGRIINLPSAPESPVAPDTVLNLAASLGIGLPLGLALAWARHRLARRIHYPGDLVERCELDVLGSVPKAARFQRREVFGAYSPGGRVFSQMRNVVSSQLTDRQRVVVVAGVAPGPAASVVAANLAAAMARAGDRVTAVAANPSTTVGLPELFGTEPVPGLADVWSGRVGLSQATQPAPRQPSLSVVGPGAAARAAGPTSEAATATFTGLAGSVRFVIVDAPPLSCSADAQLLAAHADAVILAVQSGRDSVAETSAAATAMRQIDTALLGAVLLPSALGPMSNLPMPSGRRDGARPPLPSVPADETPTDSLEAIREPKQAAETR